MQIKMVDLRRQYLSIKNEIDEAVQSVLTATDFIMGSAVKEFEADLATYLGAKHAIGCASGTDALQVAMMALCIGRGDEVITSPFTIWQLPKPSPYSAPLRYTLISIQRLTIWMFANCRVYHRQDESDHSRAPLRPARRLEPLLALAGERGLKVIEDAAQAIGARYHGRSVGTLGDIGCFSFFPSKNLGAYGDGGAMVTNNAALAERCRMVTVHGSRKRYQHEILGVNSRLDTLQAAVLRVKLRHLEEWTGARIHIAQRYNEALNGLDW